MSLKEDTDIEAPPLHPPHSPPPPTELIKCGTGEGRGGTTLFKTDFFPLPQALLNVSLWVDATLPSQISHKNIKQNE